MIDGYRMDPEEEADRHEAAWFAESRYIGRLQIEHDRRLIAAAEVWVLVLLFVWAAVMLP